MKMHFSDKEGPGDKGRKRAAPLSGPRCYSVDQSPSIGKLRTRNDYSQSLAGGI